MGIQTIINMAETIEIDRRRVMSVQYSRSEVVKVTETVTRNTWKFNLTVPAMLEYSQYRGLIEDIDRLDSRYPEVVSFSANPNLSYMFAYQGQMTPQEISSVTVVGYTGTNLILNNLPSIGSTAVLFAKGDFIQIGSQDPNDSNFYPYPVTAQYDVLRGSGSTVTVPVHRPNFTNHSLAGQHISVGNAVQFKVFVKKMPLYKMNPGGSTALVSWSGPFPLYEWTGDV